MISFYRETLDILDQQILSNRKYLENIVQLRTLKNERKAGGSWDRTVDIRNISAGLPLQPIDPNVFRS